MPRIAGFALLALGVLVLATACGAKKHASAPPSATTAATTTAAGAPPAPTTTTGSAQPKGGSSSAAGNPAPPAASQRCTILRSLGAKISQSVPKTLGVPRTNLPAEAAALQAFSHSVPPEIRGDFRVYVTVFTRYMNDFARIGLKPGKAPTHAQYVRIGQAATIALNTPGISIAERHIKQWVRAHCPKVPKSG